MSQGVSCFIDKCTSDAEVVSEDSAPLLRMVNVRRVLKEVNDYRQREGQFAGDMFECTGLNVGVLATGRGRFINHFELCYW